MIFSSDAFLLFILLVFIVYFIVSKKHQWKILLVASYVFYLSLGGGTLLYLALTTLSTFIAGLMLEKIQRACNLKISAGGDSLTTDLKKGYRDSARRKKNMVMVAVLLVNFGILALLKYNEFFFTNINFLLGVFSTGQKLSALNLLLPLGISFYTFQSCAYVIDVYRGKIEADKNLAKFALFVSFFPQIIQGPISRYSDLAHQLYASHEVDYTRIKFGLQLMLWGFFKKLVIADRVAFLVDTVFKDYLSYEGIVIFIGALLYSIQIYCDFSGGIDIIRGIAEVLGINLTENFRRPFFATSIEDFWRRWHITLGSWVREYIFYPLSLSRAFTRLGKLSRKVLGNYLGKLMPTFLAMLLTFLTVGIWHGPYWKYIAFGLYHGVLIVVGILIHPLATSFTNKLNIKTKNLGWQLLKITGTYVLVSIGRYFTRADGLKVALRMLNRTIENFNPASLFQGKNLNLGLDSKDLAVLIVSIFILILVEIFQEKGIIIRQKISEAHIALRWLIYLTAIMVVIIFGIYGLAYVEQDFIYMRF